jgi:hypothetical protein
MMLMSSWYFISVLPFDLEVELWALKVALWADFRTLQLFTALALEGHLLKKFFVMD